MRRKKRWIILALIVLVIGVIWFSGREPRIEPGSFLVVPLRGSYSDGHAPGVIERLIGSQQLSLTDLLLELEKAAVDERVEGVILKVAPFSLSFANVQEIRQACEALKAKQKQVIAWVAGETDRGNAEYYLASVADKVYFAETTMMPLLGLRANYLFLGGVWDSMQVDVQAEQMREYKTFGDVFTRSSMSEPHRDMANALLDDLNGQFLQGIAEARSLTPASVQGLIDAPTLTPDDYRRAGLIDGNATHQSFADVELNPCRLGGRLHDSDRRAHHFSTNPVAGQNQNILSHQSVTSLKEPGLGRPVTALERFDQMAFGQGHRNVVHAGEHFGFEPGVDIKGVCLAAF